VISTFKDYFIEFAVVQHETVNIKVYSITSDLKSLERALSVDLLRNKFWVIEKLPVSIETLGSGRKDRMKILCKTNFSKTSHHTTDYN